MSLQRFHGIEGEARWGAYFEQTALNILLHHNRQTEAYQLVQAAGGQQLRWVFQPDAYPPSYAMYRDGQDYFVNIAGTVNAGHWVGNILGGLGLQYPRQSGVWTHGFFYGQM